MAQVVKHMRKTNKLTVEAGLNFNVNTFRQWMKKKLTDEEKLVGIVDAENNKVPKIPKFSGSHVALTALNEKLCYVILERTIKRLSKDKMGLYCIKFNDISDILQVDKELHRDLGVFVDAFDNTLNYKDQYCISEDVIRDYIDNTFGKCISITNDAFNFLVYLLHKSSVRIIDTAYEMIVYAKKMTINPLSIMVSASVHFSGDIKKLLRIRMDEAIASCHRKIDSEDDDEEETKEGEQVVEKKEVVETVEPKEEVKEEIKEEPKKEVKEPSKSDKKSTKVKTH